MTSHRDLSVFSRRNLLWLVLFFIIGAGFFFLISGSAVEETDLFIPVEPGEISEGLTITGPLLKGLEVRVRGSKSAIERLSDLKPRYLLDLSGVVVGVNTIPVDPDRISLPGAISIIKINPSFLTVKIDNEIQKEVPVVISFSGKPAPGFFVADAVAKPSSVILRGPEYVLGPIDKGLTKSILVKGLSESFKKEIALDLAEDLDIVSPSKIIIAEIFIEEKVVTRKFDGIIVEGKGTPYIYSITPPVINIKAKGPVNDIDKLQAENGIQVYVDLKGLSPGVYVRRAVISLPVNTTLVSVEPEIFTVTLDHRIQDSEIGRQKKE
jgi:YbbR domain-containing protein